MKRAIIFAILVILTATITNAGTKRQKNSLTESILSSYSAGKLQVSETDSSFIVLHGVDKIQHYLVDSVVVKKEINGSSFRRDEISYVSIFLSTKEEVSLKQWSTNKNVGSLRYTRWEIDKEGYGQCKVADLTREFSIYKGAEVLSPSEKKFLNENPFIMALLNLYLSRESFASICDML